MGFRLFKKPQLERPDMIASWPGIGNIGVIAADTLREQTQAEVFGEIEPWDFFYPQKVTIRQGVMQSLEFPSSRFYYTTHGGRGLILFIGEEQPSAGGRAYAEGKKAFEMANMVLDVARDCGCRRVYTSGAAVALTHHSLAPRVWAATSRLGLNREVKGYPNTILMSEVEGRSEPGSITGLNGLLLGMAKKRGLDAICLMGEIPDYLSGAPFPYPRASRSVLEVLSALLGISLDYTELERTTVQMDAIIADIYDKLPPEVKERVEPRKLAAETGAGMITEEEERWMKAHIDELLQGERGDEGS